MGERGISSTAKYRFMDAERLFIQKELRADTRDMSTETDETAEAISRHLSLCNVE